MRRRKWRIGWRESAGGVEEGFGWAKVVERMCGSDPNVRQALWVASGLQERDVRTGPQTNVVPCWVTVGDALKKHKSIYITLVCVLVGRPC